MKFPRQWNIAWRVRLGLLVVPCLPFPLAWHQFRVNAETVEQYRRMVQSADALLTGATRMVQSAEAMGNHARGLHLWLQNNAATGAGGNPTEAEKEFVAPYREAKAAFEKSYQDTLAQAPPNSPLEKRLNDFYDAGLLWQREVAEPLINVLRDPKPLDAQLSWRPFEEASTAFDSVRDELNRNRRVALAEADRFRRLSTLSVLALEAAALILALWIGVSLSRAVTAPLSAMVAHSKRIEAGDYKPALVLTRDEFGQVTGAMNAMSTAIAARLEREKLAGRITAAISSSLDPRTILHTAVREIGEAMGATRCFLCPVDGEALAVACQWNAPGVAPLTPENDFASGGVFWDRVRASRATLAVPDVQATPWPPREKEQLAQCGVRALLLTPVGVRDQVAGVLGLHHGGGVRTWHAEEITLLEELAAQVAVALDNARLFEESRQRAAELQAARDALAASGVQLEAKNRELEEFVYTVSHDLKAPLISIQGYLGALLEDFDTRLPADARHYLDRANTNAAQLESLISELIELSRIGRVREQWQVVATRQLAREAAAELTLQAQAKAVQIEIAPDMPTVCCERKRVRQIFLNLLDNAIKYCDPAKPSRWVRVAGEDEGDCWRFAISDNGLGLATEHLEKAFGIFQRVGRGDAPGSGIGLSIVRRAAEAHGGHAWVISNGPGLGATFFFTLSKTPGVPDEDVVPPPLPITTDHI